MRMFHIYIYIFIYIYIYINVHMQHCGYYEHVLFIRMAEDNGHHCEDEFSDDNMPQLLQQSQKQRQHIRQEYHNMNHKIRGKFIRRV